jgi:hypothetical protein
VVGHLLPPLRSRSDGRRPSRRAICAAISGLHVFLGFDFGRNLPLIISIKERGTDDNLKAYENYLNQPKPPTEGASKIASVVVYVGRIKLGHAEWVEALQRGSENANYYTLATNTSHLVRSRT